MNSKNRIAATMYSIGTYFFSGIKVQITCINEMMMVKIIIYYYYYYYYYLNVKFFV